jgi:hypothetical protein
MKYQYYNSHTLLVINQKGQIRKLYTPFRVIDQTSGQWKYVEEVRHTCGDRLIFVIQGQESPYHQFMISINF